MARFNVGRNVLLRARRLGDAPIAAIVVKDVGPDVAACTMFMPDGGQAFASKVAIVADATEAAQFIRGRGGACAYPAP